MSPLKLFLEIFQKYRFYLIVILVVTAISAMVEAIGLSLIFPVFSSLLGGGLEETGKLYKFLHFLQLAEISNEMLLAMLSFLFILKGVLFYTVTMLIAYLSVAIMNDMRLQLMISTMGARWSLFHSSKIGDFSNIINTEAASVRTTVKRLCTYAMYILEVIVLSVVSIYAADTVVILGIVIGFILVFLTRSLVKLTYRARRLMLDNNNNINTFVVENISNVKYIKGTGLVYLRNRVFKRMLRISSKLILKVAGYKTLLKSYQEPAIVLILSGVLYYIAEYSSTAPGDGLLALLLLHRINSRVMKIQNERRSLAQLIPPYEAVSDAMQSSCLEQEGFNCQGKEVIEWQDSIIFKDINFSYAGRKRTLEHINLTIGKGKILAFVGSSGSGKTTLTDMLLGLLLPDEGDIYIDRKNIKDINIQSWREGIGYVPQDAQFFNGTIAENIAFGDENIDMVQIREVAQLVGVHSFITALSEGYDTEVGDRALRLSGGQRQRMALARALYRKPQLLILDEATSSLDSQSEQQIQDVLVSIKRSVTMVMVAHRLSSVAIADDIVVLSEGKIIQKGTCVELMEEEGLFVELLKAQGIYDSFIKNV